MADQPSQPDRDRNPSQDPSHASSSGGAQHDAAGPRAPKVSPPKQPVPGDGSRAPFSEVDATRIDEPGESKGPASAGDSAPIDQTRVDGTIADAPPQTLADEARHTTFQSDAFGGGPARQRESQKNKPPQIDGYKVLGPLGEGGMGVVWKAIQLSTDRVIALKLLGGAMFMSDKAKSRFEREVKLAARLGHSNIATIYDSGLYHGVYYYAMQLVKGEPLDAFARKRKLKRKLILKLMQIICSAVQHAHDQGVVHRDLKPDNISVTETGKPIVLDFGLAKTLLDEDDGHTLTHTGDIAGTPAYMSPEQAEGRISDIGPHTDVYALGAILFQLLTGEYPTDLTGTRFQVLVRIVEGRVRKPSEIKPAIESELEALLLKALAKDTNERFKNAGEMADAIRQYLKHAKDIEGEHKTSKPSIDGATAMNLEALRSLDAQPDSVNLSHNVDPAASDPDKAIAATQPVDDSKDNKLVLMGAGIAVLALVIGAGIYGLFFKSDEPDVPVDPTIVIKQPDGTSSGHPSSKEDGTNRGRSIGQTMLVAAEPGKNNAIQVGVVNSKRTRASVPGLTIPEGTDQFTVEGFATLTKPAGHFILFGFPYEFRVDCGADGVALTGRQPQGNFAMGSKQPLPVGQPTHVAAVYDGARIRLFVNGKQVNEKAFYGPLRGGKAFDIGYGAEAIIDEIRVSTVARYRDDFTPPTLNQQFTPDKDTLALYHFDEGKGETITDASGNGHHGKSWAKWVKVDAQAPTQGSTSAQSKASKAGGLIFDGDDIVTVSTLKLDLNEPLCMEAWISTTEPAQGRIANAPRPDGNSTDFALEHGNPRQGWLTFLRTSNTYTYFIAGSGIGSKGNERLHLAAVRDVKSIHIYINGELIQSAPVKDGENFSSASPMLKIGEAFKGTFHALRISKGPRYTGNFKLTTTWKNDANTLAHYRFNTGQGDELKDISGNNHHGKISGAKWDRSTN